MTKEDLNRQFGDPERQKPITPTELLAAAHLIRDFCNSVTQGECHKCIFNDPFYGCHLSDELPGFWNLSDAECRTVDWLEKQYPFTSWHYIDTDK